MNTRLHIALAASIVFAGQLKAADSVFDDSPAPSNTRNERPSKPREDSPHEDPPRVATPPAKPATPSKDDVTEELNARIAQLQKENAELKSKVKELGDALAALETKESAKDKTKQEHDQRVAAAKQRAENERVAKIKAGMPLSEAELLTRNKAKISSSEIVHLEPRVGYFGPLDIRKDHCTLSYTKNGETREMSLVVMEGVITELNMP
jgi:flagellar motility protein MotE (MotC chaperone)